MTLALGELETMSQYKMSTLHIVTLPVHGTAAVQECCFRTRPSTSRFFLPFEAFNSID